MHYFDRQVESASYLVDGKERIASLGIGGEVRARAMWDGASLVTEKRQEAAGGIATRTGRYTLLQDGKSLVIAYHIEKSALGGRFDEWLVLRQEVSTGLEQSKRQRTG